METRRLLLVILLSVSLFLCLCSPSLSQDKERDVRVFKSGPTQEEINKNFEYEQEKEDKAWEMLQNSFFDINPDNWLRPFPSQLPEKTPKAK